MNFFFRILSTDSLKHALNSFERKPFAITAGESVVFLYIQFALSHWHTRLIKRIAQTRLADETGSIVLKDNKTLVPRINGINASKRIDVPQVLHVHVHEESRRLQINGAEKVLWQVRAADIALLSHRRWLQLSHRKLKNNNGNTAADCGCNVWRGRVNNHILYHIRTLQCRQSHDSQWK